jgi:hypothetical protein
MIRSQSSNRQAGGGTVIVGFRSAKAISFRGAKGDNPAIKTAG